MSSSSSLTSDSSYSSSSTEDVNWFSQVVIKPTRRNSQRVLSTILVDLNIIDSQWVEGAGPYYIQVGGTFGDITLPDCEVRFEDGALLKFESTRIGVPKEEEAITEWVDVMLGRIRGALSLARNDGPYIFDPHPSEYRII